MAWHLEGTDATAALQGNGAVGLWQYLSGTATQSPMVVSVDDFIAGPVGGTPPPNKPPVASFEDSCSFLVCSFDGSGSSDPDGTVASYAWDFGDGSLGHGSEPQSHVCGGGTYTVTLTVTDNRGATDDTDAPVTVTAPPPNEPPVASFDESCSFLVCSFDGSGSSDPDGTVASYAWDFGDGASGTGANPSHTYAAAGTYTVTLTVTDNRGSTSDTAARMTLTAPPTTLYASDAFSRTTSNGWGSADSGGAWTTASGSLVTVGGGTGNMSMPTAGSGPSAFLNAVSSTDTDVRVTATTDKAPTGGGIYLSVIGRRVVGAGDYRAKVRLLANGQVSLALIRTSGAGAETVIRPETSCPA